MSTGKKLINAPDTCIVDMLKGIKDTYPGLIVDLHSRIIIVNTDIPPDRVGLISGGGSGHEPFCGGYVGEGMLTAAVAGSIFASPPPAHILTAIKNVAQRCTGGVIVIILNYTGDLLNFGSAMEMARNNGIKVESIVIDDDCAVLQSGNRSKRGMSGSLFNFKIAGAMAKEGDSIEKILSVCQNISNNVATMGVCVTPCSLPGSGPLFSIADNELELGVGVHGEAGAAKIKMCTAKEVVEILLKEISSAINLKNGARVCILVNNLGGTSQLEQYVIAGQVEEQLSNRNIKIERMYTGMLFTSLDMSGIQISILHLPENSEWLKYLDAPTDAAAWPGRPLSVPPEVKNNIVQDREKTVEISGQEFNDEEFQVMTDCLMAAAKSLQQNEIKLNQLDSGCGDGDCGSTLRRLADAIVKNIERMPLRYPVSCLVTLAKYAEEVMGGTSGAIYSLMFVGASQKVPDWPQAWENGLNTVKKYSAARLGDRTMLDALIPACEAFKQVIDEGGSFKDALQTALKEAEKGCERTKTLKPQAGRARYVGASVVKDVDAGAYGVVVWMRAVCKELVTYIDSWQIGIY